MKYLSVCSGIEAATVAWHGLGWEPVAFAEIEAFPAAVLAQHYPTVPNLGDLTKYREWPEELLVGVELLVGGTPCQAFSVAGQRRSLDDERGNLSLVYVNLYHHINEVRKRHGRPPAIALWENVPGVLSTKDNAFGCFIGGLLGCDEAPATESGKWDKAGFLSSETVRVGYRVLDAQYFGVAQRRRRVFLAAVPCELVERFGERACPSEILSLRESVLGNPPTRGAAWEGASRDTTSCTASRSGCVAGTLNGNGKAAGSATQQGAETGMLVAFGGNRSSGPLDVATSCLAHPSPNGRQDFASETFVACFHPTQDPISSTDGSAHAMGTGSKGGCSSHAVCVTGHRTHALTTRAAACEEDGTGRGTPITPAVAFKPSHYTRGKDGRPSEVTPPLSADADKGDQDTIVASPFTKAKRAQSSSDDESWVPGEVAPTQNQFDQGDTRATTVVAYNIHTSLATNGASETEWHTALRSRTPGQSENSTTTVVAFTQNSRDEVRQINGDGSVVGALSADAGMHQTNYLAYGVTTEQTPKFSEEKALTITRQSPTGGGQPQCVAFANRTRDGIKVPEVMKDGVVPALTNPGNGGRADAVNVVAPGPVQVQWASGGGKVENPTMQSLRSSAEYSYQFIRNAMQVRRLCPSECEALQGFPIGYTDVHYRKKPAADGPRYRALGNSMAVPCMWWLGHRIHQATR